MTFAQGYTVTTDSYSQLQLPVRHFSYVKNLNTLNLISQQYHKVHIIMTGKPSLGKLHNYPISHSHK